MKGIQCCQTENKPESTQFDQHVEIPNKCSAMGFPIDIHARRRSAKNKYEYDLSSATSAKYRLWQPWRNENIVGGVLSLAPCYSEKIPAQVRPDDQSGYPPNS